MTAVLDKSQASALAVFVYDAAFLFPLLVEGNAFLIVIISISVISNML